MRYFISMLAGAGVLFGAATGADAQQKTQQEATAVPSSVDISFNLKETASPDPKAFADHFKGIQVHVAPGKAVVMGYGGVGTYSRSPVLSPAVQTRLQFVTDHGTALWLSQIRKALEGSKLNVDEASVTLPSEAVVQLSGLSCEACDKTMTKELKTIKGYVSSQIVIKSEKESYAIVLFEKSGPTLAALRDAVKATPFVLEDVRLTRGGVAESVGEGDVYLSVKNAGRGDTEKAAGTLKGIGGVTGAEAHGETVTLAVGKDANLWLSQVNQALVGANGSWGVDEEKKTLRSVTEIKVSGMKCDACKKILGQELSKLSGYKAIDVAIASEKEAVARIRFDAKMEPSLAALRKAVQETPFTLDDVRLAGEVAAPAEIQPKPQTEDKREKR